MEKKCFEFTKGILHQAISDGVFPSAVCAIGVKNESMFLDAAGDATLSTLYDAASLTKILSTAMIALRAIEDGILALSDPISCFFDAPDDKATITIQNLLTHTGGFEPFFLLEEEKDGPDRAVSCILRRPLAAPPTGTPRYSCMGYILLGKILEKVHREPLNIIARRVVFEPLGMRHTGYLPKKGDFAPTEIDPTTGAAWCGVVHDENARYLGGVSGNAGVFTNIGDCARYAAMLANGGRGFLSGAMFQKAIQNHTPGHETHRGLGFQLAGTEGSFFGSLLPAHSFGHTGFTGTSIAVEPASGLYVVLLTNRVHPSRENTKILRFRRIFHDAIYGHYRKYI